MTREELADMKKAARKSITAPDVGLSWNQRIYIDTFDTPEERFAALKSFYPDVKDITRLDWLTGGGENYIFTLNPDAPKEQQQVTYYNPPGFQWKDYAGYLRDVYQGAAGMVSAAATMRPAAASLIARAPTGPWGMVGGAAVTAGYPLIKRFIPPVIAKTASKTTKAISKATPEFIKKGLATSPFSLDPSTKDLISAHAKPLIAGALGSQLFKQFYNMYIPLVMGDQLPPQDERISRDLQSEIKRGAMETAAEMAGEGVFKFFKPIQAFIGNRLLRRPIIGPGLIGSESAVEEAKDFKRLAELLGLKIPLEDVAQNEFVYLAQRVLKTHPFISRAFREQQNAFLEANVDASRAAARKFLPSGETYTRPGTSGEEIGEAIREGIGETKVNMKNKIDKLYRQADRMSGKVRVIPDNVVRLRARLLHEISEKPEYARASNKYNRSLKTINSVIAAALRPVNPKLARKIEAGGSVNTKQIMEAMRESDGILYPQVKNDWASDVGVWMEKKPFEKAPPDIKSLGLLYGALKRDWSNAVETQSPKAYEMIKRADNLTKSYHRYYNKHLFKPVLSKKENVEVFNYLRQGHLSESGERVKRIMDNLPEQERQFVRSSLVERLGLKKPGHDVDDPYTNWSMEQFLKGWSQYSDSAKDAIWGKGQYRQNLDKLQFVFNKIRKGEDLFDDQGNSWRGIFLAAAPLFAAGYELWPTSTETHYHSEGKEPDSQYTLGKIGRVAAYAFTGLFGPKLGKKFLTSPGALNWLVNDTSEMFTSPGHFRAAMGRLIGHLDMANDGPVDEIFDDDPRLEELGQRFKAGKISQKEFQREVDSIQLETESRNLPDDTRLEELNRRFKAGDISQKEFQREVDSIQLEAGSLMDEKINKHVSQNELRPPEIDPTWLTYFSLMARTVLGASPAMAADTGSYPDMIIRQLRGHEEKLSTENIATLSRLIEGEENKLGNLETRRKIISAAEQTRQYPAARRRERYWDRRLQGIASDER
jgi:uncharacterized membrane protein